jgi:hypothetical protein
MRWLPGRSVPSDSPLVADSPKLRPCSARSERDGRCVHAGRTESLREAVEALDRELTAQQVGTETVNW